MTKALSEKASSCSCTVYTILYTVYTVLEAGYVASRIARQHNYEMLSTLSAAPSCTDSQQ